jgi:hypothetical protein
MISSLDVKVTKLNNDLNERELNILRVLLVNLAGQTNAQVTGFGMALNPLEKAEGDLFNYSLVFESPIANEKCGEIKEGISRRYNVAMKMCEIEESEIHYIEDAFNNN